MPDGEACLSPQGLLWKLIPATVSGVMRKTRGVHSLTQGGGSLILLGEFSSETEQKPELRCQCPMALNDLAEASLGISNEPRQSNGQDSHRIPSLAKLESDFNLTLSILQIH